MGGQADGSRDQWSFLFLYVYCVFLYVFYVLLVGVDCF